MTSPRTYPVFASDLPPAERPISFIAVRFSGEFETNILASDCVHDPLNQFIAVDNTANLFFPTLGAAIQHGIDQAKHDLIVVVHEDVLLLPGWQSTLEASLTALEAVDPDWHLAGAVGWSQAGFAGHWSDPKQYENYFTTRPFCEVGRLDEQILIFRRSHGLSFDPNLPSIHNIGRDLAKNGQRRNRKTYAVNAATIHKYKDAEGNLVQRAQDSIKIADRKSLTYLADKSCSDDYLRHKWSPQNAPATPDTSGSPPRQAAYLDGPIVLVGRGGGGTRLLSAIAQACGLFLGNKVSVSGDSMEMVHAVYRALLTKHQYTDPWLQSRIGPDLRHAASDMLQKADWPSHWGFKLPETALLLPEIHQTFPQARYVFFHRDLESTIFRRSHMTARLDNHIGRCTLGAAYDHFGLARRQILSDSALMHMGITTLHQKDLIQDHIDRLPDDAKLELQFEQTISDPKASLEAFSAFTRLPMQSTSFVEEVDRGRSQPDQSRFSGRDIAEVQDRLAKLTRAYRISTEP